MVGDIRQRFIEIEASLFYHGGEEELELGFHRDFSMNLDAVCVRDECIC